MISRNKKESDKGIKLSGGCCIVCSWNAKNCMGKSLVVGAHVRPFESGPEFDKYNNIIALCPNHHAEFDGYAFSINPQTKVIEHIDPNNPIHGKSVKERVAHIDDKYLAYNYYLFKKSRE